MAITLTKGIDTSLQSLVKCELEACRLLSHAQTDKHAEESASGLLEFLATNTNVKIVSTVSSMPIQLLHDNTVKIVLVHDAKVYGATREPDDKLYASSKELRDRVPRGLTILEARTMPVATLSDFCSREICRLPFDDRELIRISSSKRTDPSRWQDMPG